MPHVQPLRPLGESTQSPDCPNRPMVNWVTFQTIRTADGRVLLVQKRDGCTRTIPATQTWRP